MGISVYSISGIGVSVNLTDLEIENCENEDGDAFSDFVTKFGDVYNFLDSEELDLKGNGLRRESYQDEEGETKHYIKIDDSLRGEITSEKLDLLKVKIQKFEGFIKNVNEKAGAYILSTYIHQFEESYMG